jgi:hypothetical protein
MTNTKVTFAAHNMVTAEQLAFAIVDLRKHYEGYKLPQPPLPKDVFELEPCSIDVTETQGEHGLITGRVRITSPMGDILYEQEWLVNPGKSSDSS